LLPRDTSGHDVHHGEPPHALAQRGDEWLFHDALPGAFLSNVFVDPRTLPGWLEAVVNANPVSVLAAASRGLMAGTASPATS
jgi:hypothetical protein